MYKNIIWDLDGTLFDTYPAIARAYRSAVRHYGGDAPLDWIADQAKISMNHCATTLAEMVGVTEPEISSLFDEEYDRLPPLDQPPFPGVIEVCQTILERGGRNLIVTHRTMKGGTILLKAHRMERLFTEGVGREAGFAKKPDPAAFLAMLEKYNLPVEETLAVGDREIDIQASQAAGLFTVMYSSSSVATQADMKITQYSELLNFLDAH